MPISSKVSHKEANQLLDSKEWKTDLEVYEDISRHQREITKSLGDWVEKGYRLALAEERDGNRNQFTESNRAIVQNFLADNFEVCVLPQTQSNPDVVGFRIQAYCIFKTGKTLPAAVRDFLGLFLAITASSNYPFLMAAWAGLSVFALLKLLMSGYEKLTDPIERKVFETVFKLGAELSVVNYDAYDKENFEVALGYVSPSTNDIVNKLSSQFTTEQIHTALKDLKARDVLNEKKGSWHIPF